MFSRAFSCPGQAIWQTGKLLANKLIRTGGGACRAQRDIVPRPAMVVSGRTSHSIAISCFGGAGRRWLPAGAIIATSIFGSVVWASGVNRLLGARRCELPEQHSGPHDLGAERLHSIAQFGVGGVDEQCSPVRVFADQVRDPVIRSIPATMPRVDRGEAIGRRRHGGRLPSRRTRLSMRHRGGSPAE